MAKEAEAEVRRRIITPLGEIGNTRATSVLTDLTGDPDLSVRQLAEEALERIKARTATEAAPRTIGAALELRTLGTMKIFRQGEFTPVGWRTAKTRDLLAFLAHQTGTIDQEVILEELWPEHDPDKAKGLFHTTLYYLRQAFKRLGVPNPIVYRNNGYELDRGNILSDYGRFLETIALGLHGEAAPAKACELLERAVALYRGDYLAELDYPWLLPQRENLKNLYGEARLWLARYYLKERHYNLALGHLRMLVDLNPLSEEPYRLLMTAQAGLGDAAGIQKEYRTLRELLARELNLAPARETQELYRKLLVGRSGLPNPA